MLSDDRSIRDAGDKLVEFSRNFGEEDTRSLSELLFPSIFIASKRMSSRAISRWLNENEGIKFSAASVAKVIRNQERYFERIAERVQPIAEHVANSVGIDASDLLMEKTPPPEVFLDEVGTEAIDADHYHDLKMYLHSAISQLRSDWFSQDREIRFRSLSYFDFTEPTDEEDEN